MSCTFLFFVVMVLRVFLSREFLVAEDEKEEIDIDTIINKDNNNNMVIQCNSKWSKYSRRFSTDEFQLMNTCCWDEPRLCKRLSAHTFDAFINGKSLDL